MMRIVAMIAVTIGLASCQPGSEADVQPTREAAVQPTTEPTPPAADDAMPANYDWRFTPHGGSGDLDFGEGDWAEGFSIFHLSCLPNSKSVAVSWGYPGEAVLTSGRATATFAADARVPTDHPVFAALKTSGEIVVGVDGADMTLSAKPAGRAQLQAFFDYCTRPPAG